MSKIDFVLTWVDENDSAWQAKRHSYIKHASNNGIDNGDARFRDWGTLKYWFRGVEQFAPWVHKIYFVTDHQIPTWLNTKHPKLKLINHEDYIDNKYLPTFNSHTIENNMHKIPGLSENFVYFNDDMFIIKKVSPKDFFRKNLPRDIGVMAPIQQPNTKNIGGILINNLGIINENFDKNTQIKKSPLRWFNIKYGSKNIRSLCSLPWHSIVGFYEPHVAISFQKSTFRKVWQRYPQELEEVNNHRFRDNRNDISQWLFRDWQIASNQFVPRKANFSEYFDLSRELEKATTAIRKQKYHIICPNDSHSIKNFEAKRKRLQAAFEQILPHKSRFER